MDWLDIVSNKKYKFFQNLTFEYVKEKIDEFYIDKITPLDYHLKELREIALEEIVSLYKELNGFKKVEKKENVSDKDEVLGEEKSPSDPFLQQIIFTKNRICDDMAEHQKQVFIKELNNLVEEYVSRLKQLIDLGLIHRKINLITKLMPKLVDIEFRILEYNKIGIPKDNLKDDHELIKKLLYK